MKVFKLLRPGFKIPSRYEVADPQLKNVYKEMHIARKEHLTETTAILVDGWSKIR